MNKSPYCAGFAVIVALAMLSLASPVSAQQTATPALQQAPAASQPAVIPGQAVVQPAPAASEVTATPADSVSRPLKSTVVALRELSPWSMFLSADILVKAVMIGLAFASLVTWTIFIAKMIELSLIKRRLRAAVGRIGDARSLAEEQFALWADNSISC